MNVSKVYSQYMMATVIYEGNTYSLPFETKIKFCELSSIILNNLSLYQDNVYIKYKAKKLSIKDERKLSQIILNDKSPKFEVIKINLKKGNTLNKSITKESIIQIINYLSQDIILFQLQSFYQQKNSQNLSNIIYKDQQIIQISFPSYQLAEEFLLFFKYVISMNPMLSQTKIELVKSKGNESNLNTTKTISSKKCLSLSFNTNSSYKTNKTSITNLRRKINHPKKKSKHSEENFVYNGRVINTSHDEEVIDSYFANQKYLRNSSPYISEEDKYLMESNEDKKNWINKKGFCVSVGNYSNKYKLIDNYVTKEPSESPLNHKFRSENKKKWITEKGFC